MKNPTANNNGRIIRSPDTPPLCGTCHIPFWSICYFIRSFRRPWSFDTVVVSPPNKTFHWPSLYYSFFQTPAVHLNSWHCRWKRSGKVFGTINWLIFWRISTGDGGPYLILLLLKIINWLAVDQYYWYFCCWNTFAGVWSKSILLLLKVLPWLAVDQYFWYFFCCWNTLAGGRSQSILLLLKIILFGWWLIVYIRYFCCWK
jgi:hypothetical protein